MFFYVTHMTWFTPFDGDVNVNNFASFQVLVFSINLLSFFGMYLSGHRRLPSRLLPVYMACHHSQQGLLQESEAVSVK